MQKVVFTVWQTSVYRALLKSAVSRTDHRTHAPKETSGEDAVDVSNQEAWALLSNICEALNIVLAAICG